MQACDVLESMHSMQLGAIVAIVSPLNLLLLPAEWCVVLQFMVVYQCIIGEINCMAFWVDGSSISSLQVSCSIGLIESLP